MNAHPVCVAYGEALGRYGFGGGHPFGTDRMDAFLKAFREHGLEPRIRHIEPQTAGSEATERFHTHDYVQRVQTQSRLGMGYLDYGDTPAPQGIYEAAATVVGTTLDLVERIMAGECRRAFTPIAGLHHARRDRAGGFCVFNDCGIAIETLRAVHGVRRVGYVDIDAHHGDGVYYAFADDPEVAIADIHEDGRYLYPGTGGSEETGRGGAEGTKLNIPMPPDAGDEAFYEAWQRVEAFLTGAEPEIILFQCGADSVGGDPLTHLQYTPAAHTHAAYRLCGLAEQLCQGRLLAMGGGGYNRVSLGEAWSGVVGALLDAPEAAA